jgi:SAM-dependent methyltransferase
MIMAELETVYRNRWTASDVERMRRVWSVLVADFFQKFVRETGTVLDVGAGFCHFINQIRAKRRIAVDANPGIRAYADPAVELLITDDLTLPSIPDGGMDHVFISNFLEHLPTASDVIALLRTVKAKLAPGGTVLILQPNLRFTGAAYFDFIDHKVALTDKSLIEALEVTEFRVVYLARRFLPYTSKSKLPRNPWFVRLYLALPFLWRLFGQQTFVVAEKSR